MKNSLLFVLLLTLTMAITGSTVARANDSDDSQTTSPHKKKKPVSKANQKSKKTAKKAKTASATPAKKKTVGELLQQADRGGLLQLAEKGHTALPTFKNQFASSSARASEDLSQVKPPRTSDFMEDAGDDQSRLDQIIDQQIQELYKLTQRFKNSPRRGEFWLRLAELYVEKAGNIDFRKQGEYDRKLADYQSGKSKIHPRLDISDALDYNRKAIQLYEWFVRDFPRDEKMDQALYFLGYNYFELNDLKQGLHYYSRLTKEYPQSSFVTESHFALAEYYFEKEQWRKAMEHYQEVVRHPRNRLYGFSSYKLAWCQYRSGDTKLALHTMERLVQENRTTIQVDSEGKRISKSRLEKEALRDMVLFYSDRNSPAAAPEYFGGLAGADAPLYLEKLAYLYADKGQRDGAKTVFEYLISMNPTAPKAFDYKYQVIQAFATAAKTREFRQELYSWVHDYGVGGRWYQANKANTALMESSTKLREATLKSWILMQHQTAQNSHSKFAQDLANEGYKVYLQEFGSSANAGDMHFFYAELLFDMEKFDEAGVQYRWVVENAPNSKYATKAAENIVLALEHDIPKDSEIAATVGKSLDPVALNPKTENFVNSVNVYLAKFPQSAKAAELKFRVGRLYYQHNQFDKAIPYFKEIVQNYPHTKYADYSANLLLDSYNLKKDYAGLERTGQELLASPSIANSAAGKDIRGVLEKAQFKRAQDLEVAKNYSASAQQFEAFGKQNPTTALAAAAFFDAGINYERAGQNAKAIESHQTVMQMNAPEAVALKPKSRRILAKLYQDAGMLEEAAKAYHQSAEEAGKDPLGPNLYYDAAVLDEALGRNREAIENYNAYYAKSKKAERVDVIFEIAQIHQRAGQLKTAADMFKQYFETAAFSEKSVEAGYQIYNYHKQLGHQKEMETWKHKTLSAQRHINPGKKGPGASWVAKILLDEVNLSFAEMRHLRIPANPATQQKIAQQKIGMLNSINKSLAEVIQFDSPDEIVGALILSGRANQHMGEALVEAPVPAGLKPDEEKAYRAGIQKVADPFFSKARESFKTAIERADALEAYDKDLSFAREAMAKLDPASASDHGERVLSADYQNWMAGQ